MEISIERRPVTMPTLKDIREAHYLSRRKLADLAGVSESTIVRIESAAHKTTKDVVEKVLKALSKETGETFTLNNVEGLNLYNIMRDRKQRPKGNTESSQNKG
jgi:transcriptional regulator with XRE-family HTH domain